MLIRSAGCILWCLMASLVRNGVKKEAVARKIVRKGVKRSAKEARSANKVRKVEESTLSSVSTPPGSKSASESSVLPP